MALRKTIKPGKIVLHSHLFFISDVIRGVVIWERTAIKRTKRLNPDTGCVLPSDPFHENPVQNLDRL
jgi:hypothetical protein